jgi:hypothetical protein
MTSDRRASMQSHRDVDDTVLGPAGGARHNQHLMSDPIGADVGPNPAADGGPLPPADGNGAIDGLPGRYERQADDVVGAGLDLMPDPLGATL